MTLVDSNVLLYAYHPRAAQHERCRAWVEVSPSSLFRTFACIHSRLGRLLFTVTDLPWAWLPHHTRSKNSRRARRTSS